MERIQYNQCTNCGSQHIEKTLDTQDYSISGEAYEIWTCNDCQFCFTQNVPSQAYIAPYYKSEDYISHSNSKEGLINNLYHRVRSYMLYRKYRLFKTISSGKNLLDYGSGTGYFPAYMKAKDYQVTAIEMDDDARAFAKQQFKLDMLHPDSLFSDNLESPFDIISLWHVMEHLYDPKSYLNRFHELLSNDGKLVIAVPNHTSTDAKIYGKHWSPYDVPRHLWHFSPNSLISMADSCGFTIQSIHILPFDGFYASILSEKFKGRSFAIVRGFWNGFRSYLSSLFDTKKCSSIIYILSKSA